MQRALIAVIALGLAARGARADDAAGGATDDDAPRELPRTRQASLGEMFRGPFRSARLFAMPTADVIGAYVLTLSGEGSLLQQPGVLTAAGVLAIGFGDIAQIEYRHTDAIGITDVNAPVPAVGVQLKLPIPEYPNVPAFGVAFRLGVPRGELLEGKNVDETVTDLYVVGRLRFAIAPWLTLHGGTRISSAKAVPAAGDPSAQRTLVLPTAGYEIAMNPWATIVGEIALAPRFAWLPEVQSRPMIGRGLLGRFGMKWRIVPAFVLEGSLGYQIDDASPTTAGVDAVITWDIRLGAAVFVPWGALVCRAVGVFCNQRAGAPDMTGR
jgi:hypothetical protein